MLINQQNPFSLDGPTLLGKDLLSSQDDLPVDDLEEEKQDSEGEV